MPKVENTFYRICDDICVTNKHLYLLTFSLSDGDNVYLNQIIKFEIHDIKPVAIYKLPGKWFTSFCVPQSCSKSTTASTVRVRRVTRT
jgi:hypothetical protein